MLNDIGRNGLALAEVRAHIGAEISGTYLLTECLEIRDSDGIGRLRLQLHDATGSVRAVVWPECRARMIVPALPCAVAIEARVTEYNAVPELKIRKIKTVDADDVACASALLPLSRCPTGARNALMGLIDLERSLPEPLAGFLRRMILNPEIGIPFLRCRASVGHHHSQIGGLLIHSTESLNEIAATIRRALPDDPDSVYLGQLGYLLHDLGKVRTVGEVCRPQYGLTVRHEFWTPQLLAPHLHWLERQDQRLALGLSHILDYVSRSSSSRGMAAAEYLPAEVVVMFDQMSAAAFSRRDLTALLRGSCRPQPLHRIERAAPAANDSTLPMEAPRAAKN